MKRLAMFALALIVVPLAARAEEKKAPLTVAQVLNRAVSVAEKDLVPLIEAMPEEKLDWAPTGEGFAGARTFRQQVVHITGTLRFVAAGILGEPLPSDADQEVAPEGVKSRAELAGWVKATFAHVHKAIDTIDASNAAAPISDKLRFTRLGLAEMAAWHTFDHYGQLVIYARMNGVVPPASRPQPSAQK